MPDLNALESLYFAALEKPPAERPGFLDAACGGDRDLRAGVERLLAAEPEVGDFLGQGAAVSTTSHLPGPPAGGTVIAGRYSLVRVIGEGGMGSVWLAEQTEPVRREVALKLIKAGMDSRQVLARFEAERQALALMDHPNIARVFDGGTTDGGRPFFVMELVRGVPLTDYCDLKRLGVKARLKLFVSVCRAVQHAHQKGIIHRDLKPGNVLVTEVDGRPTPKVLDFGVAKAVELRLTDLSLADTGAIVGTPAYMSPEQADPTSMDIDTRTDVYALGAILYELLVGTPPIDGKQFKRGAILEMLRMVREVEPLRPSTRLSTAHAPPSVAANRDTKPARLARLLRGELDWVVMKALEKDRTRRYDTAGAMAHDVLRYLSDEVVEARPPSRGYRLKKLARRHKGQVLAASLVLLALLGGIAGTTWGLIEARRQEGEAKRQESVARDEAGEKEKARARADSDAARARAGERLAYDRAYNSDLRLLQQAWERGHYTFALDLLDRQQPERTDGAERRGFEWDYWNGQKSLCVLTAIRCPQGPACVAYSPDGKLAASGGAAEGSFCLKLWDAATGKEVRTLSATGRRCRSAQFSPDGKRLVGTDYYGGGHVWEVATGMKLYTLGAPTRHTFVAAYSPDGRHLVTGGGDGTVRVWDADTGKELLVIPILGTGVIDCVAFSRDGKRVAAGGSDGLRLCDVATGKNLQAPSGSTGPIRAVAFSPIDDRFASGGEDGRVRVWGAEGGTPRLFAANGIVNAIAFSPDGKRLAAGGINDGLKIWDVETGRHLLTFQGQGRTVNSVAFSPDGTRLGSGEGTGGVVVWDAAAASAAVISHDGPVKSLSLSADGERVYGGNAGTVHVWDALTGAKVRALGGPQPEVRTLAVHPSGQQFVARVGVTLEVRDAAGTRLKSVPYRDFVTFAVYSPDGQRVVTLGSLGTAVWSVPDLKQLDNLPVNGCGYGAAYDREGKRLAVRDAGGVAVWEADSARLVAEFSDPTMFAGPVALSPDGQYVAVGNTMGVVTVWDLRTKRPTHLTGHTGWVTGLAYSPDGRRLASSGLDGSVRVWEPVAGEELLTLTGGAGGCHCVAFSACGTRLLAGTDCGVRVWEVRRTPAGSFLKSDHSGRE